MLLQSFLLLLHVINAGILMDTGHPCTHFAFLQLQAAASFFHCFVCIISKANLIKVCCSYLRMPVLLQELSLIHLPLFVTSAISTSAMMCITLTQFQKCTVPLLSCRESVSSLPHQNQSYDRQIPVRLRRQISLHRLP